MQVDNSCPGRLPVELKYRVVSATHAVQDFIHSTDGTLECSISENVFIKTNTKYSVEVTAKNDMGSSLSVFRNFSKLPRDILVRNSETLVKTKFILSL